MTKTRNDREGDQKYGLILVWAQEGRDKKNDWPGIPTSQIPLMCKDELDLAIKDGKVRIVERPAKTNPDRMASFVVLCDV